jgi:hypothetical protein
MRRRTIYKINTAKVQSRALISFDGEVIFRDIETKIINYDDGFNETKYEHYKNWSRMGYYIFYNADENQDSAFSDIEYYFNNHELNIGNIYKIDPNDLYVLDLYFNE